MSAGLMLDNQIRAASSLSQISRPEQHENETKACFYWRLIRQSVQLAIENVNKEDSQPNVIKHGIHHLRNIQHVALVECMLFNKLRKEYIVLGSGTLRIFHLDGRKKDALILEEQVDRLLYAAHIDLYMGWNYQREHLYLFDAQFELKSSFKAPGQILAVAYNEELGEIVTIGSSFLTSWVFRYGGRYILPRRTCQLGMDPEDYFHILVLEGTISHSQKAFAASSNKVAIFNLYEGKLLDIKKNLHSRSITSMLFFNPLKYLVTADRDGTIKIWSENWKVVYVFVGHFGCITSLELYPFGPLIMSSSDDSTIRVWSLELLDEVDCLKIDCPVDYIKADLNYPRFFSVSGSKIDLWDIVNIHDLQTTVGHKVFKLQSTSHPMYSPRAVMLCSDTSVRISCPLTGNVITTLLMNQNATLVDVAYAKVEDILFALFGSGKIIKADTTTNPCTVIHKWKPSEKKLHCNCLLVYEYFVTSDPSSNPWSGIKGFSGAISLPGGPTKGKTIGANRTLLLGGRKDGQLCVFNWKTGDVDFKIEGHGDLGVVAMVSCPQNDQVISVGVDNIIKVWRLYPYAQESLAPLMSFYCAHPPTYMTMMCKKLVVSFEEELSATYNLVMYDLETKQRFDHSPDEDHMERLSGLTSCSRLKLIASCSVDGSLRIWNEKNRLVREIKLNEMPHSLAFCSEKGDLLLGVGKHVNKISYKKYMPKSYRFRMVAIKFNKVEPIEPIPFNEDLLDLMPLEDVRRLKTARSAFRFASYTDIISAEETNEVLHEKLAKEKACSQLDARDSELKQMIEGELSPQKKKPKLTIVTKRKAFDKYLKIFYKRPHIKVPKEDPFPKDTLAAVLAADRGEPTEPEEPYKPDREPTGFFPEPANARQISAITHSSTDTQTIPPIRAGGFVPNSVLTRLLWPDTSFVDRANELVPYRPPQLTEEQLAQLAEMKDKDVGFRESTLIMSYDDDESELVASEPVKEDQPSSYMQRLQETMARQPTPPMEKSPTPPPPAPKENEQQKITPKNPIVPLPPRTPKPTITPQPISRASTTPVSHTPLQTPSQPYTPNQTFITEVPPDTSAPTPKPDTPLPDFISQFIGVEWFDKHFPDCDTTSLPKPWTFESFISTLLKILHTSDIESKVGVVSAIRLLWDERDDGRVKFPHIEAIHKGLLDVLTAGQPTHLKCTVPIEREFIISCLKLLSLINVQSVRFYVELIYQFLDADKMIRNLVMGILRDLGLKDTHDYLPKELDSWDIWSVSEKDRPMELRRVSQTWLQRWMASFKNHVTESMEKLKQGQGLKTRTDPRQLKNSTLKIKPEQRKTKQEKKSETMTVTFDPTTFGSLDAVTYIEAINYFCEMQLEKHLEKMRSLALDENTDKKIAEIKNTVLVLPKIQKSGALVRLGETHTSLCRPRKDNTLSIDFRLPSLTARGYLPAPGQLAGFPACINLPLKQIYINPFPSEFDDYEHDKPLLVSLKSSPKYFVIERTYVATQ